MSTGSMGRIYIGSSGLQANQYAMNTTAHNLTNIETTGYSRQQVLMTDRIYQNLNMQTISPSLSGTGTTYQQSRQLRDELIDRSYRSENGRESYYNTMHENLYEIQDYFGELEGSTFRDTMQDMWSAFEELAKDTNNVVNRSALVAYSSNFISKANEIYNSLNAYRENLNTQIKDQVARINEIGEEIWKLNKEIVKIEGSNIEKANDYKDQRNNLLDELSSIIDVKIHTNKDQSIDVFVEDRVLVTTGKVMKMETTLVEDDSPFVKPVWKDDQSDVFDFYKIPSAATKSDVGGLKAVLMSRGDDYNINYTGIPVGGTQDEIDAYNHDLEPYSIANVIAQFDQLIHSMVTAINDKLCPNKEITLDDGTTLNILDERLVADDGTVINEGTAGVGVGQGNEKPGTELFKRTTTDRYKTQTVTIGGKSIDVQVYQEELPADTTSTPPKSQTYYTLGYVTINEDLVKNPSLLPLSGTDGSELQDRTKEIVDLWNQNNIRLSPNTLVDDNYGSYYTNMITNFSDKAYTYNAIAESAAQAVIRYDDERQQQLGVSSEEELTNMIKYQSAYNASSRYINVVSEMLEHIITRLGGA